MDTGHDAALAIGVLAGSAALVGMFFVGRETAPCWGELEDCQLRLLGHEINLLTIQSRQERQYDD